MEKKIKKHQKILLELKRKRKMNEMYCDLNNCSPTPYMDGSNKTIDEMIEYIERIEQNLN